MVIHKVDQGTYNWRKLRAGKMTASRAQAIGNAGKGLETLAYETVAEKYSIGVFNNWTNADMDRGHELEELAVMNYEMWTGKKVERVGFVEMDEYVGCSPDGLVGEDGGLEIKCPNDTKYLRILVNGEKEIDSAYLWQVQMCLFVTGRKSWDLFYYNPNFQKSSVRFTFGPDEEMQEKLKVGMEEGKKLINALESKYEEATR